MLGRVFLGGVAPVAAQDLETWGRKLGACTSFPQGQLLTKGGGGAKHIQKIEWDYSRAPAFPCCRYTVPSESLVPTMA